MSAVRTGKGPELSRPGSGRQPPQQSHAALPEPPRPDEPDDGDEGQWNEFTPVASMPDLFKKVGQTASMVRQLVDGEIPALREQVKESVDASKLAQREAYDAKNEATLAKERIEDVRQRVELLEPVKTSGATTKVEVDTLAKEFAACQDAENTRRAEDQSGRRWLIGAAAVVAMAVLSALGGTIWWAGRLDSAASYETQQRETGDDALVKQLSTRPTRDEVLTRDELRGLRDDLNKRQQPTVKEWLDSLPESKRRSIEKLVGRDLDQAHIQ